MNLPLELEQVLLRFLGGPALAKNTAALERGLVPTEAYSLTISERGGLNLGLSVWGNMFRSLTHGNPALDPSLNLESSLEHPELQARLKYLNSRGIVRFLLGREPVEGKPPVLARIGKLDLYSEDPPRARIEFGQDDKRRLVELHLVEGQWVPMKSQTWKEYQEADPPSPPNEEEKK